MVETKQVVSISGSWKNGFDVDEIKDLNAQLNKIEVNCKVILDCDDDGYTLNFEKVDI